MSEKEKKCTCGCDEHSCDCEHDHECDCGCEEDIVELTTEDGKKLKFYFVGTIEYKGKNYSAFEPAEEIEGMWDEVRRFNNPHNYYVDLSEKLWKIKDDMISSHRKKK